MLALLLAAGSLSACEDDEPQPRPASGETLLMAKTWALTGATEQYGAHAPVEDAYADLDSCKKDDLDSYRPNGVFSSDQGPLACSGLGQPHVGTCRLAANQELTIVLHGNEQRSKVLELTATKLVLQEPQLKNDELVTHTYTFTGR